MTGLKYLGRFAGVLGGIDVGLNVASDAALNVHEEAHYEGRPLILPLFTYSKTNTREVVGNTRVRPLSFW